MVEIIEVEYSDNGSSKPQPSQKRQTKSKKTKKDNVSDLDDANFSTSSRREGESSGESENDTDVMEITNKEVHRVYFTISWYTDWILFVAGRHPAFKNHPIYQALQLQHHLS